MGDNGRTYRGVTLPEAIYKAEGTGFQTDPYVVGWKEGVDAHYARTLERAKERAVSGKLGFEPNENIRLDAPEDMMSVRCLIHVLQDEPDKARALVRAMSGRDRALFTFTLGELSRVLSEEEDFRTTADRRAGRASFHDAEDRDRTERLGSLPQWAPGDQG